MLRGKLPISALAAVLICASGGCSLIVPTKAHKPVIRNPFPQLSRVAVAPFSNQSDEPTLDGRQVALAYFSELQSTPGFEVVPLGVVEEAIIQHRVDLSGANEARRLANILGVDAVVVGSITDFSEYYPPRIGLRVEWYAANPGFHEIPAGYGLPWNTHEEEFIPDSLVYESQMALARQQFTGLTPDCDAACTPLSAPATSSDAGAQPRAVETPEDQAMDAEPPPAPLDGTATPLMPEARITGAASDIRVVQAIEELPQAPEANEPLPAEPNESESMLAPAAGATAAPIDSGATTGATLMPGADAQQWLGTPCDAAAMAATRPPCNPQHGPVLSHTRIYHGNDADVTEALEGYVYFRDDQRFGGYKSYLSRSDDFIRFCCHMHISEMLSARGGSRKTQVVWRWPESR